MDIQVIRHSLAHILAYAVQKLHPGVKFGIGPVIENGFYYDFDFGKSKLDISKKLFKIEEKMRELLKKNIVFEKKLISKKEARKIFKDQPYKLELIKELTEEKVSLYKSGDFIDLCKGPHIKNTKEINPQTFKLTKIAGAYWQGDEKNPMLTRIYGVAFKTKKELEDYLKLQEEIEKRDHRKLGKKLDLFSFHPISPGAVFWHPRGMIIVKELEKWWRKRHEELGYLETSTPILVKRKLFEESGHWDYYRENMFLLEVEKEPYVLKPMNCPESTLIYSHQIRSYRDLPLRLSEIGRLHRFELSGVLAGLFRVRQITMDDAHIYVTPDQILSEIIKVLDLIEEFYKIFSLPTEFHLATKPDKAMGGEKLWRKAEKALELALKEKKLNYKIKPKDGAFYGPKIDVHITDVLGRSWQIATLQLDFQMPERFDLFYIDKNGKKKRPVMIHRAIFGSFERFIGILLEHTAGALPLWLSPEQLWIIPVGANHKKYAKEIAKIFQNSVFRVQVKDGNETVAKKIREGEIQKIPYLLVVGEKEMKEKSVRVRKRGKGDIGQIKINQFLEKIKEEVNKKK
jgi:threonyl-tRNA synthetase